ncbi:MAG: metallophosphoesterase [Clostridiales bacterium]|nr:metallophosphoesterase [Clostridiales bacterium]
MIGLGGFWYFENFTLTITEVEIHDEKIQDAVTIVQITDLHGASFGRDNRRLIRTILNQEPDLVVATGDMYTNGDIEGRKTALALLEELAGQVPVYFVNGEHDHYQDFLRDLCQAGVRVLDYQEEMVQIGGTKLHLYGINNVYYSATFDLTREFTLDSEAYTILLAHILNRPAFSEFGADLTICGDTHGGIVRLPKLGPIYFEGEWFPGRTGADLYDKGLFEAGEGKFFISSGLGSYPYPVRLFNRPEVAVIRLLPAL